MGLVGKAIDGFVKDAGEALDKVGEGAEKLIKGGAELGAGALTLNPKEMKAGVKDVGKGGFEAASNALELTPDGLESSAANNLLEGALDECGIGGKDNEDDSDSDNEGGISLDDLSKAKDIAEMMPEGMKPGFLKI